MSTLSYTDDETQSLLKFLLLVLLFQQELLSSLIGLLMMTPGTAPGLMPAYVHQLHYKQSAEI